MTGVVLNKFGATWRIRIVICRKKAGSRAFTKSTLRYTVDISLAIALCALVMLAALSRTGAA